MHNKDNKKLKTLGHRAAHLVTTLYEQNRPIFQLKDVQNILHLNQKKHIVFMGFCNAGSAEG